MPRRALKPQTDAAETRERLRARCRVQLEQERKEKRSQIIAQHRNAWWAEAVRTEAKHAPTLTEEAIGQILREEYERARIAFEQDGATMLGDVDVDEMVLLEEEIQREEAQRRAAPPPTSNALTMQIDL